MIPFKKPEMQGAKFSRNEAYLAYVAVTGKLKQRRRLGFFSGIRSWNGILKNVGEMSYWGSGAVAGEKIVMSMSDDDFERLRRELVFEQVSKAIKENPKNWASKFVELGFQWVDDESGEEVEENIAKPENLNQELLVAYFKGAAKLSEQVLDTYLAEKESATPNYPLIRKYFKRGNEHLRRLLIFGLERRPTDIGLLTSALQTGSTWLFSLRPRLRTRNPQSRPLLR